MVSIEIVRAFTKLTEQQGEERIRLLKEAEGLKQGRELFKIGLKTSEEHIARVDGYPYATNGLNITLTTFPVTLKIGDKEIDFTLQATGPGDRQSKKSYSDQLPLSHYESVSICPVQEGSSNARLFSIGAHGHLTTPLKGNNSSEEVRMVSDFLGIIQQSLSERRSAIPAN